MTTQDLLVIMDLGALYVEDGKATPFNFFSYDVIVTLKCLFEPVCNSLHVDWCIIFKNESANFILCTNNNNRCSRE